MPRRELHRGELSSRSQRFQLSQSSVVLNRLSTLRAFIAEVRAIVVGLRHDIPSPVVLNGLQMSNHDAIFDSRLNLSS